MKHILNDLSEEEKNAIREQHTGGMKINNQKFSELISKVLGDVKPYLSEQKSITPAQRKEERDKRILNDFASVKFGQVTAGPNKGKMWCKDIDPKLTEDERSGVENMLKDRIIYTTPRITKYAEGWNDTFMYIKGNKDGWKLTGLEAPQQDYCDDKWYFFNATDKNNFNYEFYSDGEVFRWFGEGRKVKGRYTFQDGKPVLNFPLTKKAVGFAQTEEDITDGNKILYVGSRGDLVKRIQFEIMLDTNGEINVGCKPDENNFYKPSLCDGIFGKNTKKGVIEFQTRHNLTDKTGIVGAETWEAMDPVSIDSEGSTF